MFYEAIFVVFIMCSQYITKIAVCVINKRYSLGKQLQVWASKCFSRASILSERIRIPPSVSISTASLMDSVSSKVLAALASDASACTFCPTIIIGSSTNCRKAWATQATSATMLAFVIAEGNTPEKRENALKIAGKLNSAKRQKTYAHVMVPTRLVIATANFLLNRA